MTVDAREVATWILNEADKQGIHMTHMKLQKLLYYAQAHFIGMTGEPLFHNHISAWEHGPVVPDVYRSFSRFGSSVISDIEKIDTPDTFKSFIRSLICDKGRLSAHALRNMTHNEPAWQNAWLNPNSHEISNSMIAEQYSQIFWTSDEEDDFQPDFSNPQDEEKFMKKNSFITTSRKRRLMLSLRQGDEVLDYIIRKITSAER